MRPVSLALLSALLISCADDLPTSVPSEPIVARIGEEAITARDFRGNYEFGFAHLKVGDDRKRAYLDAMVRERLLSLEGYRLGLDDTPRVRRLTRRMHRDLAREGLIERDVRAGIQVTPEEIREELHRSKVRFRLRWWPEATREAAAAAADRMRQDGWAAVVEGELAANPELPLSPEDLTTELLTHHDVRPEVLAAVQDVEIGGVSDPVRMEDGSWAVFQVVDIRRQGVMPGDYAARATTLEQSLFYQKLKEGLQAYVGSLMVAQQVVTKGPAFARFAEAVVAWEQAGATEPFRDAVAGAPAESALGRLRLTGDSLYTHMAGGDLTVAQFVDEVFDERHLTLADKTPVSHAARIKEAVALSLRDHVLWQRAADAGLDEDPVVLHRLHRWRDKWVYEAMRQQLLVDGTESNDQARRRLHEAADALRTRWPVHVDTAALAAVEVTDFGKSRWATVMLFAGDRPALPMTDPIWGLPTVPHHGDDG